MGEKGPGIEPGPSGSLDLQETTNGNHVAVEGGGALENLPTIQLQLPLIRVRECVLRSTIVATRRIHGTVGRVVPARRIVPAGRIARDASTTASGGAHTYAEAQKLCP